MTVELPLVAPIRDLIDRDLDALRGGRPNALTDAVTPITAELLRWWFEDDLAVRSAQFHEGQRDAILSVVYAHEVLGTTSLQDLYEKLAPAALLDGGGLFGEVTAARNAHPKYAAKMATGTGKTWVLNALLVWQYLNHRENPTDPRFSSNFLIVAPGLIVYERLLDSLRGHLVEGRPDFSTSDLARQADLFVPPTHRNAVFMFAQSAIVTKADIGAKVTGGGMIAVTNWHLLVDKDFTGEDGGGDDGEDDGARGDVDPKTAIDSFFPLTPGTAAGNSLEALDRRFQRGAALEALIDLPDLVVFNDEAHHIHTLGRGEATDEVEWQRSLNLIAEPKGRRFLQVDFSATPYNETGGRNTTRKWFPHIVCDFPLETAMRRGLVKTLALDKRREIAALPLDFTAERDEDNRVIGLSEGQRTMIRAGLQKLDILRASFEQVDPGKHPKLLIMTEDTRVSPYVVDFLVDELGLDEQDVLRVDSDRKGDPRVDWEGDRERLFDMDRRAQPRVVVSVLMLREGFDVNNICVIVPLRSSSSGILLEQTIGRGLRLMWRDDESVRDLKRETRERLEKRLEPSNYFDLLFVVEHPRFEEYYQGLIDAGAAITTGDDDGRTSPTGDLERVQLKPDWVDFDIEVPLVLRGAEEELETPSLDIGSLPVSKMPLRDAMRYIGDGDRFASTDVLSHLNFGEYRVQVGSLSATGYNEYLAKITNRVTGAIGRTFVSGKRNGPGQYPAFQAQKALISRWIDTYIRSRYFGEPYDPFELQNWRVLLIPMVVDEIQGTFATALVDLQQTAPAGDALVEQRSPAEVGSITMRSSTAVDVFKSVYPKVRIAARGGGLERRFVAWLDDDTRVEAFVKIDEYAHDFLRRPYLRADGMPAQYSPDFLVRTASDVYVVETKAQSNLLDVNVQRKKRAALAWCEQINELEPGLRSERRWHYVLVGEKSVKEWRDAGESASSLLNATRLYLREDAAPTLDGL
jgi:type III restriction enzyme